jgi:predicted RNA-binding protein with PUA-like domain
MKIMAYFLAKADPDTDYGIDDLARDGETLWDGVHNNAAILHIKAMRPGDYVYIYHSQKQKSIVGLAKVVGEPFENTADPRRSWAVKLGFEKMYQKPVTLAELKLQKDLQDFSLIRIGRLSVMPVTDKQRQIIESLL